MDSWYGVDLKPVEISQTSPRSRVISQIVRESAIQGLIEDKGCDRDRAEELAEYQYFTKPLS